MIGLALRLKERVQMHDKPICKIWSGTGRFYCYIPDGWKQRRICFQLLDQIFKTVYKERDGRQYKT